MRARSSALVLACFVASDCSNAPPGSGGPASGSQNGSSEDGSPLVTWSEDVAPIVYRECVGCHHEGSVVPFVLTSYAAAAEVADSMAAATRLRVMPPMPVDNSGSCNTYSNARWLSDEEIKTIGAWAEAGAPQGDPELEPPLPPPPEGLERVDAVLDPGDTYTQNAALLDDYRCFVVDPKLDADGFLVAYDLVAGDPTIVHHAIVYGPTTDEAARAAEQLDAEEPGLGYTCFGGVGVAASPLALWAPGVGVVAMPADTGLPLAAGRKLVLQVHYHAEAGIIFDRTTVRLRVAESVARPGAFIPIADLDLEVPAGEELTVSTRRFDVDETASYTVHGVLPHMHTLGRILRLDAQVGDDTICLVDVDRWDFHWQNAWWYETPMIVEGANSVSLSCGYDTLTRSEPVTWGEGTNDEMCLVYLYITL